MIKSNSPDTQYLSYTRPPPSASDATRLANLENKQQSLWQTIRQNVSEAKKEFKKMNEQLKQELSNKLRVKAEVVDEILRTLDSKIEFVIQSCEKYGNRIMQHVNGKIGAQENTNISAYNQKFELITQKMRVLEQRLFGFKQNEEQLKSRLEVFKDKNNHLSEQYRSLSIRLNQRINQLEHQLREKTEELRKKENNDAIKFTFVHPTSPPQTVPIIQAQPQAHQQIIHKTASQQSSGITHYNPPIIQHQHQNQLQHQNQANLPPKKQIVQKQTPGIIQINQTESKPQPLGNNNSIEIRPDFFRNNSESNNNTKGINLRSIRQQQLISGRKGARENQQMSESQYRQRGRNNEYHDHRFDYLMNNLVATQADSNNNTPVIEDSRASSRISGFQSSYIHR